MLLNIGSGDFPAKGWVNVDAYAGVNPDVLAGLDSMPFETDSADMVYAGHVLEHIAPEDLPAILSEVRRVLKPGGRFAAVGPDVDRIDPIAQPDLFRMASKGHDGLGVNPHAPHLWDCTEARLLSAVRDVFPKARAVLVADLPEDWPVVSRVDWQCAVESDL